MQDSVTAHFPANKTGRDFVIGDLHGCFQQLMEKLSEVRFDVSNDRLFSVGDLVDRGPESLSCLRLLAQPWFFAVRGNHESMLLNYLGLAPAHLSSRRDFIDNGGGWVNNLSSNERQELLWLSRTHVLNLPYQIKVEHSRCPFFVTHSGHGIFGEAFDSPEQIDTLSQHELEQLLWERDYLKTAIKGLNPFVVKAKTLAYSAGMNRLKLDHEPVGLNEGEKLQHLVYAGHNALRIPILANSHFFIDTGCGKAGHLTLIDHNRISEKFHL